MSTVTDSNTNDELDRLTSFENWRDEEIAKANTKCSEITMQWRTNSTNIRFRDIKGTIDALEYFPKTMVRLTRHMCECKEDCTRSSLKHVYFRDCKIFNLNHVIDDDRFFDSPRNTKKVVDGKLYDRNVSFAASKFQNDIKWILYDLCSDKKGSVRKLKCKAYELKEFCGENSDCLANLVKYIPIPGAIKACHKPEYEFDLKNIGGKIWEPNLFQDARDKREVREYKQGSSSGSITSVSKMSLTIPIFISVACFSAYMTQSGKNKIAKFLWLLVLAFMGILLLGNNN